MSKHNFWIRFFANILIILAGCIALWPPVGTLISNQRQNAVSQEYDREIRQKLSSQKTAINQAIERAYYYNETLDGSPVLDPFIDATEHEGSSQYGQYLSELSDGDIMARIRVPSAHIDLPVRHGTSATVISSGAGHMYGTALPVGCPDNQPNCTSRTVLTSHTGMTSATLFDHLTDVHIGDIMYLDVYGKTLAYKVTMIDTILPTEANMLRAQPNKDILTLFTCTPYGVNTHRLVVDGERIPYEPGSDTAGSTATLTTLSLRLKALLLGGVCLVVWGSVSTIRLIQQKVLK